MAGNMQDNFDENGNPIRCSFCGKEQGQVRRLVKGPTNIFICDECVAACSEILEESLASDFMDAARNGKLPGFLNDHGQAASQPAVDPEAEGFELEDDRQVITHVPTPHEIYDELSAYVMGQEDAKRAMSVAVYNHYRRVIEGGAAVSAFDGGMGSQFFPKPGKKSLVGVCKLAFSHFQSSVLMMVRGWRCVPAHAGPACFALGETRQGFASIQPPRAAHRARPGRQTAHRQGSECAPLSVPETGAGRQCCAACSLRLLRLACAPLLAQ